MDTLKNKIDFALIIKVKNANPNGDPLNGNRPRTDYSGNGEITDVCLKRKMRDRLVERYNNSSMEEKVGQAVFVQSDDRRIDDAKSLRERAEPVLAKAKGDPKTTTKLACETWIDVRAFGQLFAFKADKKKKGDDSDNDSGVSIGIRGPVTIQSAFSLEPVSITSTQITKSVSGEGDGSKRGSDTMGMKHRVDKREDGNGFVYVAYGSMNPQLAERTLFSDTDAEVIKSILPRIFENDASSARPEGSMEVMKVLWWKHNSRAGQYSSAKVHRTLQTSIQLDGYFDEAALKASLPGLTPEVIDGF